MADPSPRLAVGLRDLIGRGTLTTVSTFASAGVGALLGVATCAAVRRVAPQSSTRLLALTLVPVALVYPAARRSTSGAGAATMREAAGVAAMALTAVAATRTERPGPVAAIGWLAHAGFDLWHDAGHGSLIPGWYPAFCAGYDVAVAADLVLRPQR